MLSKSICASCKKGVQYANLVSHAKNRTHIIRKPNLHSVKVLVNGKITKQKLCTKCLRSAIRPHKVALEKAQQTAVVAV